MKLYSNRPVIFALIYLLTSIGFCTFLFLNFKKQSSMVKEISHNMIAIQDFNTLKTALSPLLKSDIRYIEISYNKQILFKVGQSTIINQLNSFNEQVEIGGGTSYKVFIQFSAYKYLLMLVINLIFTFLIYSNYFNFKNKLDLRLHITKLSQKLAHDIRTPLSTLNLISSKISDPEIKRLQLSVVKHINEIANDLLNQSRQNNSAVLDKEALRNRDVSNTELAELLLNLEKEYKFKSISLKQKFVFRIDEVLLNKYFIENELLKIIYPIINNLIQNSVDATTAGSEITIYNSVKPDRLLLVVEDNGRGMPADLLAQIGNKPISFGKQNTNNANQIISGNGIALFNAKNDLARFDADLLIESRLGFGTKISIALPFVFK